MAKTAPLCQTSPPRARGEVLQQTRKFRRKLQSPGKSCIRQPASSTPNAIRKYRAGPIKDPVISLHKESKSGGQEIARRHKVVWDYVEEEEKSRVKKSAPLLLCDAPSVYRSPLLYWSGLALFAERRCCRLGVLDAPYGPRRSRTSALLCLGGLHSPRERASRFTER